MRTIGSPAELERRRLLAVERVNEGYSTEEVAEFLGIDASSVRRWVRVSRRDGRAGLRGRPVSGRPPKLTPTQEKLVLRWLADNPTAYGFATELWTAPRLAQLIEEEWGIALHPRYLCQWLRARGLTPQKPRRVGRERNDQAIAAWLAQDWPRIKKRPAAGAPTSFSLMKAGC
jgi:transposase